MKKLDDETKEKFLVLAMLTPVPDIGSGLMFHRVAERYYDLLNEHGYTSYSSHSRRHVKERFPNL